MKHTLLILMAGLSFSKNVLAGNTYVDGYTRRDGTYVQGYYRTTPDNTVNNNYGTKGNLNPYTGNSGTRERDPSSGLGTYNSGNGLGDDD